ncbi:MAG: CpsD/CapB family tyrosine-protein kinase [Acidobacteria bacterium]|nr:CpsD/CapB family tyrosine-protein kinase [Acidobacteriota bacterium]
MRRAKKDNELLPAFGPRAPHSDGTRHSPLLEGMAREDLTKLVQHVFLLPTDRGAPCVVLFCGVEHEEGSSWICARAGQTLAAQGTGTVCVVDANLRSPSLHEHLNLENLRGLADALVKEDPIRHFAQPLSGGNLWLVPGGFATPDQCGQLGAERMRRRLAELRSQFSHVLINTPPASLHADAILIGKLADGVILVVEANSTRRETTRQVKDSLEAANVRLLAAVLNQRTFPIPEALYRRL